MDFLLSSNGLLFSEFDSFEVNIKCSTYQTIFTQ